MSKEVEIRIGAWVLPGVLVAAGEEAKPAFERARRGPGPHVLLTGDRDYLVRLDAVPEAALPLGEKVQIVFRWRPSVNRRIGGVSGVEAPLRGPLDLGVHRDGAPPLYLLTDGRLSGTPDEPPAGRALGPVLVTAARWVSARRRDTFARLFPPSAFHPDEPLRTERLSVTQAQALLAQLRATLADQPPAQVRSAALTVLSHLVATARDDMAWRDVADAAAAEVFALIDRETEVPALRAHAIRLLQLRAPQLRPADRERAVALLRGLVRAAPPYAELRGPWHFAMCSGGEFHEGEVATLKSKYDFVEVPVPEGAPSPPGWGAYTALEAPFRTPAGEPVRVLAREASPRDENFEMGQPFFTGMLINRHAQLGAFDMQAAQVEVRQQGYKLMMNSQCAGLTTRFAMTWLFPDADIYSSWDSTYFRTGQGGRVVASEGLDCFVAILEGMARGETHAQLDARVRKAQWIHPQSSVPDFVQFVGPAHPLVVARFSDVNRDGRADLYDGFLDLDIQAIAEDLRHSASPRSPGVPATAIGGEAAHGLGWAAGSMNRVTQYSDIWAALPGKTELLYAFEAAGFYDDGDEPARCRFSTREGGGDDGTLTVEVMMHAHLSHAARELKRLLVAAEAMARALDEGHLPAEGPLATRGGQRGAMLLMLAGLLEFPADQNFVDGLWAMALQMLRVPPVSRSVVRACITNEDHDASNYYGSVRGLAQLMGEGGALHRADPVAWATLRGDDPLVGRAAPLQPLIN